MNKSKLSMINAIFALIQMGAVSIIGLVIGRSILTYYGSDYNGVNSIVTQLVNVIMVLEGGFTLASNVALFKPFGEKNIEKINGILSATGKRFNTVSIIAIIIGTIIAIIFPLCITTPVSYTHLALTLALKAMKIGAGDAVFVPDFTFFASGETPALEEAVPVFVDVEKETFNISAESLRQAIEKVKTEGKLIPKACLLYTSCFLL